MKLKLMSAVLIAAIIMSFVPIYINSQAEEQNINLKSTDVGTSTESIDEQSEYGQALNGNEEDVKANSEIAVTPAPQQTSTKKDSVILDAPIIKQNPELYNGCEVCSLDMLLLYKNIDSDKMTLAKQLKKDTSSLVRSSAGKITKWGDPEYGFVGDITGKKVGYGVYDNPLLELLEKYMPGKGVNLTGESIEKLFASIENENPVVVWVTCNFNVITDFVKWESRGKVIKATFSEHAVLLVGYDKDYCYVNNPINGQKKQKVDKVTFENVWKSMGSMAISCS